MPVSNNDRVPQGQHLTRGFPVLTYGPTPEVSMEDWQLKIWGEVKPRLFSWQDMLNLPQSDFTADFHCVTTWSKLDVTWRGIRVTDFMAQLELPANAKHVLIHCYGGYTTNLAIAEFMRPDNFFAHQLDHQPLPAEHGGPMRLVVPHLYAWKSAKWVNGLEFTTERQLGFWERNGYHHRGDPWLEERYSI
ncbi:oxidoreductase molybdopterin binding protein [Thalassoporum mexicanum PCC 7367]|uniref:sulfite oxidase-like oxidoreductase n=1 Tax=Thalassoporum mexicanum TaxID=3457544 RepID=UPI00029FE9CD|nr:oxidoreductase molybdopterin binding protein [Pseudanabaena sp. PCC 7367]